MSELDKKISLLVLDETELLERLSIIRKKIHTLKMKRTEKLFGVKVGSTVLCNGKEYRVAKVFVQAFTDKPWIKANPKRKDGSFGVQERNLYTRWTAK